MQADKRDTRTPDRPEIWHLVEDANSGVEDRTNKVGLALISRDFKVLDADDVHRQRWPDLIGKTCYEFCNRFAEPCVWCPVQPTFEDGGVHHALAASPKEDSQELEYSHIISFPAHRDDAGQVDVAVEVLFNLTRHQKETVELSKDLHDFLKGLCSLVSRASGTTLVADLLLFAAVSRSGLALDEATVLQIPLDRGLRARPDYARTLAASAIDEETESLIGSLDSPDEVEGGLDALLTIQQPGGPEIPDVLGVSGEKVDLLIDSEFPRRIDGRTIGLCIKSPASPVCLVLIAKLQKQNRLLLDYQLNDAALLQALFCHAFDAARVAVPITTALHNLQQLLSRLQQGGENIAFAAPIAYGMAHDLPAAFSEVARQVMRLEAELGAPDIDRQSLRQILGNLRRAESRLKVCRSRLQSIATLFKQTRKQRQRCHLSLIIDEVAEWLAAEFKDHAIVFEFVRDDGVNDLIRADKVQVSQVIYNLVANAIKALRAVPKRKRRINVRAFQPQDPGLIGVSVTDTAGSLLPEVQPYIYEPFFSTDSEGIGLGLWIVKAILEKLGTTPQVHVRAGVSTIFQVLLPREW